MNSAQGATTRDPGVSGNDARPPADGASAGAAYGGSDASEPADRYAAVRAQSEALCRPLAIEDYGVQPMDDASPPKWHLAHTTWFFETFLLQEFDAGYRPVDERYHELFNSYYNGVGDPYPRPKRGLLSRPTVREILGYRAHVDAAMQSLLARDDDAIRRRTELGLNHEQQHQELMVTDLKYNLGLNPLKPAYREDLGAGATVSRAMAFDDQPGGIFPIGARSPFCFDNELPRHKVLLQPFSVADRLVTNGEFLAFIEDGGYDSAALWLAEGWSAVAARGWHCPLYWRCRDGQWLEYRLGGEGPVAPDDPVVHVSAFEADAYARWAGCRLPTEFEWETAAAQLDPAAGNFADDAWLHPRGAASPAGAGAAARPVGAQKQLFGDVWEWTSSAYGPYPGYRTLPGALGEYNGKFMSSQLVLRGGSCATPRGHVRASYRNFFYPPDRWQFSGIRLARDPG